MAQYQSVRSGMCRIETVSSADARTNAAGFRRLPEDPKFIIAIPVVVAQFVLRLLKPLTLFWQKTDRNMVTAFDVANS